MGGRKLKRNGSLGNVTLDHDIPLEIKMRVQLGFKSLTTEFDVGYITG